jgi:catechol 2,3-dioxygenase-like lactoylglutathione lyase family enzyme
MAGCCICLNYQDRTQAEHSWFQAGDVQLHLREEAAGSEAARSNRHPAFEVANLSEVRAWLTAQGVAIELASPIEGRQRFFFRDPFGNRLELLQFIAGK